MNVVALEGAPDSLASLVSFDDASRSYRMDLPGTAGLLVERWRGRERLADGLEW